MRITKRGQADLAPPQSPTAHVAAFVSLLVLFIILYIFLLPTKEREELLNITQVTEEEQIKEKEEANVLLSQSPGLLYPFEQKEEELASRAKGWIEEVKTSGEELELEPMSPWQRRIVHMVVQETEGVESESIGEGRDRHLVIRVTK